MLNLKDLLKANHLSYAILGNRTADAKVIDNYELVEVGHDKQSDHGAVALYSEQDKTLLVAHRGSKTWKDWVVNNPQIALGVEETLSDIAAKNFTRNAVRRLDRKGVEIEYLVQSGHSKGGRETQVSLKDIENRKNLGIKSLGITFNAAPVSMFKEVEGDYNHVNLQVSGGSVFNTDIVSSFGHQLGDNVKVPVKMHEGLVSNILLGIVSSHKLGAFDKLAVEMPNMSSAPVQKVAALLKAGIPIAEMEFACNPHPINMYEELNKANLSSDLLQKIHVIRTAFAEKTGQEHDAVTAQYQIMKLDERIINSLRLGKLENLITTFESMNQPLKDINQLNKLDMVLSQSEDIKRSLNAGIPGKVNSADPNQNDVHKSLFNKNIDQMQRARELYNDSQSNFWSADVIRPIFEKITDSSQLNNLTFAEALHVMDQIQLNVEFVAAKVDGEVQRQMLNLHNHFSAFQQAAVNASNYLGQMDKGQLQVNMSSLNSELDQMKHITQTTPHFYADHQQQPHFEQIAAMQTNLRTKFDHEAKNANSNTLGR